MTDKHNLDLIDLTILSELQKDGRKSFSDIAKKMNLAVGTVRNRYQRLERDKVVHIIGWTDPIKAGYNSYSRISIEVKPAGKLTSVIDKLLNVPQVRFLALTSGNYQIEINVICEDNEELVEVIQNNIQSIPGVYDTNTTVYFKVLKWASQNVSWLPNKKSNMT